jgi:hypothetical protein
MNMPGFTAAHSSYKSDKLYHNLGVRRSMESVPRSAITAQAQFIHFPVDCDFIECYQSGGHFICYCS